MTNKKKTNIGSKKNHDSFFKAALEKKIVAYEFFEEHLPNEIRKVVDLENLKMENSSFIEEGLKKSISDILFSTTFNGNQGYIWLLLEHQSTNDHFMTFRLLKYMINIWQRYLEKNSNSKTLPLIYPMIFYNGKAKYTAPLSFFDLFHNKELACLCVNKFQLVNINEIPDEELKQHVWSGILKYFMKHIFDRNFLKVLEDSKDMILKAYSANIDETLSYLKMILYYNISKVDRENSNTLKQLLNEITIQQGENIMASLAHVWQQEGIEKGMQQGIKQGREEVKMEIIRQMLKENVNVSDIARITGFSVQEIEEMKL